MGRKSRNEKNAHIEQRAGLEIEREAGRILGAKFVDAIPSAAHVII